MGVDPLECEGLDAYEEMYLSHMYEDMRTYHHRITTLKIVIAILSVALIISGCYILSLRGM